jgi:Uma2 family endonuclease
MSGLAMELPQPASDFPAMRTEAMSHPGGSTTEWTYSEYARLPDDGNRYEVIDGEVCVTPAPGPPHQRIAARLYRRLDDYVREHQLGEMYWDVDLLFVSGQFLRPDMVFVPKAALGGVTDRGVEAPPGLIVEILSPHSRRIDLLLKPKRYLDFGVPDYWVVDPRERAIHCFRLEAGAAAPEIAHGVVRWQPAAEMPPLEIDVAAIVSEG